MVTGVFTIPLPAAGCQLRHNRVVPQRNSAMSGFIAGPENRLLLAALQPFFTSGRLSRTASPLVLCGGAGSGKTHLATGLAAHWNGQNHSQKATIIDGSRVRRVTRFWRALSENPGGLLVLEKVEKLAAVPTMVAGVCRLLDAYQAHSGGIIVTASQAPNYLSGLSTPIRSRLLGGLVVPLHKPSIETRREIIHIYEKLLGVSFSLNAVGLLTSELQTTTGKLIEIICTIVAEIPPRARDRVIGSKQVIHCLGYKGGVGLIEIHQIAKVVAGHYGTTVSQLRGRSRRREISIPRSIVMSLAHNLGGYSLAYIGKYLGKRDHTTVMHGCRIIEKKFGSDVAIAGDMRVLVGVLEMGLEG